MKLINSIEAKQFQPDKHQRKSPKFGPNGTKYGTKGERKHRDNHQNRKHVDAIEESNLFRANKMTIRKLYSKKAV